MMRVRLLFKNGTERTVYTNKFYVRVYQNDDGTTYNAADYSKRDRAESIEYLDLSEVALVLTKLATDKEVQTFDADN